MASVAKRKWTYNGVQKEAWTVRYLDAGGAHRSRQFERKKEAEEYKRRVEREMDDGTHVARGTSRTVAQTIREYLVDLDRRAAAGQVGPGYHETAARLLEFAVPVIGERMLVDLTWQHVESYSRDLRKTKGAYTRRALSNGTIRSALASLSRAVAFGVRRGYASRNVVPDALAEVGHLPTRAIETFTRDEMRALVAAIENRRPKATYRTQALLRAMTYLGGMCGLRRGEIFALTWKEIDLDGLTVTVRHNLTPGDVLKAPKTPAGRRTVPMPRMVADAIREWTPYIVPEARGLIFRNSRGAAWQDATWYRDTWHPLLNQAGIASDRQFGHRHFHALRHFAGSAWLDAGVSLPEVSRLLGHANMQVTARIYSHAIEEVHHRAVDLERCAGLLIAAPVAQGLLTDA